MKEQYNFTCPNCFYEQSATPSLFMKIGYNDGCGGCMNCDAFLHLEIVPDIYGDEMEATFWDGYLDKKTIEVKT